MTTSELTELMRFYNVETLEQLVAEQAQQIARLQNKLLLVFPPQPAVVFARGG